MKTLDRHLGRTVLTSMLAVLLVVVSLNSLFGFIAELRGMQAHYQVPQVLCYMLLTLPRHIYTIIPVTALIGCLVGLGRLAGAGELVAMRAAGVSLLRISWAVMKPGLLLVVLGLVLGELVVPDAEQVAVTYRKTARSDNGVYTGEGLWHREGNDFMYFNAVRPDGILRGVSIFRFDDSDQLYESLFAEQAAQQGDHWILENVRISRWRDDTVEATRLPSTLWHTRLDPALLKVAQVRPDSLSVHGLFTYIRYLDSQGLDAAPYRLAFYKGLLQPLAIFSLLLIGVSFIVGPLRTAPVGQRLFVGIITGMVFMIAQDLLAPFSLVLGFSPLMAVAAPVCCCFLLGGILLRRAG
ncbi:MAG: LPS export ABC transporter permease LptG [Kistimonas sp.]|nr:LPS export ABC transporter permease LptG [Kistimonas sp.]